MLDHSDSMKIGFSRFKSSTINFIKKIKSYDPNAKIRIVWFSTKADAGKEYDLSVDSIDKIESDFSKVEACGGTRLSHTILDELQYSKNYNISKQYNHIVVTFTDGRDSQGGVSKNALTDQLKEFDKIAVPFMLTVGCGTRCSNELLGELAAATGGIYRQLDEVQQIEQIFAPATTNVARDLKEFFIELVQESGETEIVFDGTLAQRQIVAPQLPDINIPFRPDTTAKLTADHKTITISVPNFTKITVANDTDLLREMSQRMRRIANNAEDLDNAEIIRQLKQLQDEITALPDLAAENTQKESLQTELKGYLDNFERAKTNKGYEISARVLARHNGGVIYQNSGSQASNQRSMPVQNMQRQETSKSYVPTYMK